MIEKKFENEVKQKNPERISDPTAKVHSKHEISCCYEF